MKKLIFAILLSTTNVYAGAILKDGACPSGYHQSGRYCVGFNAAPVVERIGPCPSGYHQSGKYCLGNSKNTSDVIEKNGPCPSGYHPSGSYCKENR